MSASDEVVDGAAETVLDEAAGTDAASGADGTADTDKAGPDGSARGVRTLAAEQFSLSNAVGGVRGVVESVAPVLLFVVVYLATEQLVTAVIVASAVALLAVVLRLVGRTPLTQAFSGVVGVGSGLVFALITGQARDYFLWGLWTNAAYLVGTLATILIGWPVVGVLLGLFDAHGPLSGGPWSSVGRFRSNPLLRRRAIWATWVWVGVFAARLAVQVPVYRKDDLAWLGTAKLVMGVPLFAVALWISWLLVRRALAEERPRQHPDP
jgi:hypothetical protein